MSEQTDLPTLKALRDMLLDLLGRNVELVPSKPWSPTSQEPGAVAVYVDDSLSLRALICCDLPLSVALGASIALTPARTAAAAVQEGCLPQDMVENLNEVLNILAGLFNTDEHAHVKLYSLFPPGQLAPADLAAHLREFGRREDLTIEVAGYGGGRLSFVLI